MTKSQAVLMQTKKESACKAEILERLKSAKDQIEQILFAVESNKEWKDIHIQIELAVFQLRKATKLLVLYHLEVCVVGKHREMNTPIVQEDIDEIVKTYRYLN